jgi:hypothetical protein
VLGCLTKAFSSQTRSAEGTSSPAHNQVFGNIFFVLLMDLDPRTAFRTTTAATTTIPSTKSTPRWNTGPITVEGVGSLSFLPSDWVLLDRKGPYYPFVKLYAEHEDLFRQDFAQAFGRLMELGTAGMHLTPTQWWTDIPGSSSSSRT